MFGNLVDASQGKAEREAVLGNGDSRQIFQTFPLPKAPLTYFLPATAMPPQTPELEVCVDGRLWTRVDALLRSRRRRSEIYIVREDADGRSYVQFGDGETGARLPSGCEERASPATAAASARAGRSSRARRRRRASGRPASTRCRWPASCRGGADPEDREKAREAAPGKVQSLGRLVSLRDYETETLSIPGVVTATAAWDLHDGVPAVILRVLLEAGREAEFADVRATIAHAQRCRGPDRFPLVVRAGAAALRFLDVDLRARSELQRRTTSRRRCARRSAWPAIAPTSARGCSACRRGGSASASTQAASRAGCRTWPACCGAR